MSQVSPSGSGDLLGVVVSGTRLEGETVAIVELSPLSGKHLPDFSAGAHIDVVLPGDLVRPYSLSNPPDHKNIYRLGVLLEPQSRGGSMAIHGLKVGDHLNISAPRNHFPLAATSGRSVLLGGGIGVTPMLAMAHELRARGSAFELHYCVRTASRTAFVEDVTASPIASNVVVHCDDGPRDQRLRLEKSLADPTADDHLYLCGPEGFTTFVVGTAEYLGWAPENIHTELFSRNVALDGAPFTVQVGKRGAIFEVASGESIAQVLRRNDVGVRVSCENGLCGSCLMKVLKGTPDHRDAYLSEEEKAGGKMIIACCSRALTPSLVLEAP